MSHFASFSSFVGYIFLHIHQFVHAGIDSAYSCRIYSMVLEMFINLGKVWPQININFESRLKFLGVPLLVFAFGHSNGYFLLWWVTI